MKSFEDYVFNFAKNDPWLTNNPPEIEWFEGQFESGQTQLDDPIIKELGNIYKEILTNKKKKISTRYINRIKNYYCY